MKIPVTQSTGGSGYNKLMDGWMDGRWMDGGWMDGFREVRASFILSLKTWQENNFKLVVKQSISGVHCIEQYFASFWSLQDDPLLPIAKSPSLRHFPLTAFLTKAAGRQIWTLTDLCENLWATLFGRRCDRLPKKGGFLRGESSRLSLPRHFGTRALTCSFSTLSGDYSQSKQPLQPPREPPPPSRRHLINSLKRT